MNDFLKEKELLLNSIENNTSEHWKNYYKDVPIECIYDDLVIDINEIKRLQQENQQLKDNWNKLKEYFEENLYFYSGYQGEDREEDLSIKYALEKMNELEKGNEVNE